MENFVYRNPTTVYFGRKTEENAKTTSTAITRFRFMTLYLPVLGYLPKFFFFAGIETYHFLGIISSL